jgi:ADP-ribose pyrophosphatase YjhB (NUDIX family)
MKILRELLLASSLSFSQLQKATDLSSDHFNFHIQKLIRDGLINKTSDGYTLSRTGKEYANRMDTDEHVIEKQPKLSVALIIENDKGEFLSQQRLKQPFYGFWGRPTGKIRWGEQIIEAAKRELLEETGLTAKLRVGGFYHKMDRDSERGDLLEDKLFCLIYGCNPKGTLIVDDEGHHNEWLSNETLMKKEKVFESVPEITKLAQSNTMGFIERYYNYTDNDY